MRTYHFIVGAALFVFLHLEASAKVVPEVQILPTVAYEPKLFDGMKTGPFGLPFIAKARATTIVDPVYPPQAIKDQVEGFARLDLVVDEKGRATEFKVMEATPDDRFVAPVMDGFKKFRFQVQKVDGKPIRFETDIVVFFRLSETAKPTM